MTLRDKVFAYINKQYSTGPESPWIRFPDYAVFRHTDNGKLFALVMDVPRSRLGLSGETKTDLLNVKMPNLLLADLLVRQEGYLRGWHIRGGSWVSVLLDGTVPLEEICHWIDESYLATASAKTRQKARPPKEWIIPANPKYYDVIAAFQAEDEINWKQGAGIKTGDTVYLYVAAPVSAVLFKCAVTQTDIPFRLENENVRIRRLMRIRLLKRYPPDRFSFERLGKEYGIFAVRGPRGIPESLSRALQEPDSPGVLDPTEG